ncbi:AAA family ATPase [Nocardioides sp. ChNu-153]|uniref:AAA family ATPase n=1 Tax=unclassified Nocardioides TaxID=2615069 RepID=UPI002405E7B5|nr:MULTISPECIES: AAA family ATPase [unclassified Nocardioides]MDF9717962.1 AAA family ATPase [Nocardioides sp. ChNu-99]MDN7122999.1 AAA family ATPase [Nocardioides sp. ChNu-153]
MRFDQPPVVRVAVDPERPPPEPGVWPLTVPAVAQLVRDGFDPAPGVTFLVGENGSGKSTIVEALAEAYGLPPEGGSTQGGRATWRSESALARSLRVQRGIGSGRWGFFLRAETMHGWYTFNESTIDPDARGPRRASEYHLMSHGESFLEVSRTHLDGPGFYCLDEPEAALSFSATLGFIGRLAELVASRAQVVCATHSPVLASLPGARILELGPWGMRETTWDDLELVEHWKRFLDAPGRYLRHVLE